MQKHIIIHIDDDLDDLEVIGEELKKHDGVEVFQFTNAEKGIKSIKNMVGAGKRLSLIILDINIPGLNGKDALVQLKKNPVLRDIPVVLFSTSNSTLDMTFAEKYNASFETKPVQMNLLHQQVEGFISKLKFFNDGAE